MGIKFVTSGTCRFMSYKSIPVYTDQYVVDFIGNRSYKQRNLNVYNICSLMLKM